MISPGNQRARLAGTTGRTGESDATGVVLAAEGPVFCAGDDFAGMAGRDLQHVRRRFLVCTRMILRSAGRVPVPPFA